MHYSPCFGKNNEYWFCIYCLHSTHVLNISIIHPLSCLSSRLKSCSHYIYKNHSTLQTIFLSFSVLLCVWFWDKELRIWKVRKSDLVTYFTCMVIDYIQTITTVIQNQAWANWCYDFWNKPTDCCIFDLLICFFMLCYFYNFMLFKLSLFYPLIFSYLILIALVPFFYYFYVYFPLILPYRQSSRVPPALRDLSPFFPF